MIKGSIQEKRCNNYKYICTQHRSTSTYKANTNRHQGETDSNTIVGKFNTPLSFNRQITQTENKETQALNDILDQIN